jgi:serine/threonine protein kinase
MDASLIGNKIGNYRIRERIAGGGVGCVWKGEDEALGRPVAIKMLRPEMADREGLIERFRGEAQIVGRLNHPNIATVYSLLEEGSDVFLVMEYVEGETLATRIRHDGPGALEDCFDVFHQVMDGIHHAHEAGVVHRDIKPSNVMVDARGLVKLLDFGIARTTGTPRVTRVGGIVGTPHYMSPEQVQGEEGTVRSDVYALGLLLYELTTGSLPFEGDAEFDVMRAQVEATPPSPRERGADLPEPVEAALLRALRKDPAERYPTVLAFQDALVAAGAPARTGCGRDRRTPSGEREAPSARPTRILDEADDAPTRPRAAAGEPPTVQLDAELPPTRIDTPPRPPLRWLVGGALLVGLAAFAMNQVGAWEARATDEPTASVAPAAQPVAPPEPAAGVGEQPSPPEVSPGAPRAASTKPGRHADEAAEPVAADTAPAVPAAPEGWEIRR